MTGTEIADPDITGVRDHVAERSIFLGMFQAVNPARPVSPINSRLLASFRKKFKSQIMGQRGPESSTSHITLGGQIPPRGEIEENRRDAGEDVLDVTRSQI